MTHYIEKYECVRGWKWTMSNQPNKKFSLVDFLSLYLRIRSGMHKKSQRVYGLLNVSYMQCNELITSDIKII